MSPCRAALPLLLVLLSVAVAAAPAPVRQDAPEAAAGPYRIRVDRIAQSPSLTVTYRVPGGRQKTAAVEARQILQVQLAVLAPHAEAAAGLSGFQLTGVSAEVGGRVVEPGHYGGLLDNPNEEAALRAHVYVPGFPSTAREIRAIEGALVAYEKAGMVEIDIPLDGERVPRTATAGKLQATLRDFAREGDTAQIILWVEGPPESVLLNPVNDGTYGVSLRNQEGRSSSVSGGSMLNPRPNQAEYRMTFQNLRGTPASVRVRLLQRIGPRRTYPFRIEHLPLPTRQDAAASRP